MDITFDDLPNAAPAISFDDLPEASHGIRFDDLPDAVGTQGPPAPTLDEVRASKGLVTPKSDEQKKREEMGAYLRGELGGTMFAMGPADVAALDATGTARAGIEATPTGVSQGGVNLKGVVDAVIAPLREYDALLQRDINGTDANPTLDRIQAEQRTPLVTLPKPTGDSVPAGVARGLGNVVDSLSTPENLALMAALPGAPAVLQKVVAGGFATQMAAHAPEQAQAIGEANTPADKAQAVTELLASLAMIGAAGAHAAGRSPVSADVRSKSMDAARGKVEAAEFLKGVPIETLQAAAADPKFRETSPYDPALIDAEIVARPARELAAANSPLTAAETLKQGVQNETQPSSPTLDRTETASDASAQLREGQDASAMPSRAEAGASSAEATRRQPVSVEATREGASPEATPDRNTPPPAEPAPAPTEAAPKVEGALGDGAPKSVETPVPFERPTSWKQSAVPEQYRMTPELESALSESTAETATRMGRKDFGEGGAFGSAGGGKPIVNPVGATPKGDPAFIRVGSAPSRAFKGLFTDGAADVMAKQENKIGQLLSKQIKKHVDLDQEIGGQLTSEIDRAVAGLSKPAVKNAIAELEPYLAAKENGRPLPQIGTNARKLLTAWENIAEQTGLLSEAHNVQVFDPTTGGYRPMHRIGRAYVPRVFKPEVQQVLSDPKRNPKLFNDLAAELAKHRGVSPADAAKELRGVAGRFQASDFMGNMEMARTGQLPEIFYDYNLGNIAARYIPAFSERMAQIIAYGQRLGPREAPLRQNLWDVAMKEAEDSYTQQWIRAAEDQSANLKAAGGPMKVAQQGQTLASGLLLSSPTTSVIRNMISGLGSTAELLGVRRSIEPLVKAATDAQTKLSAKEMGVVRENIGDFLHNDQLGNSLADDLIRGVTSKALKFSGYNASETFVRTHAAATASQFAKDGVAAILKNPASSAAKEALGLFKRAGADAAKIVAEGADWKTGAETRKFIRGVIRETQGGYRFDQTPLWAGSPVGRFLYQFGRWGTQRARNIWRNGIEPLIGEEVEWHGKKMVRRDAKPIIKMGLSAILAGEAFALISQGFFGRDRKDASIQEIQEALSTDQKEAFSLAGERLVNDVIMSGMLGIFGQPIDYLKSLKDQSRFKNPAEPPAMSTTKAVVKLAESALDQEGRVTKKDLLDFIGGTMPGAKQLYDLERNVFDEPLYEAENDVRTLRTAATRWAAANKLDVPKRSTGDFRKSAKAPEYGEIYDALLVGDSSRARFLADKFATGAGDKSKAMSALKASVKGRQPFRVGPFTSGEYRADFMKWAAKNLPKADYQQAQRVQDRYEAAAKGAGLW